MTKDKCLTSKYKIAKGETKVLDNVWVFAKNNQKQEILIKAVVEGGGSFEARGRIKILKNLSGIEVFLRYQVLLLDQDAKAVVIPELEIESQDIKAGHAASVGRIDEEQLFYLQSRGLSRASAVKLIVEAFLI